MNTPSADIDAFLTHADADEATALALRAALNAAGLRAWCAARDLVPGDPWDQVVPDAIERARVLVVLVSAAWPTPSEGGANWYPSEQVALAIDQARDREPPLAIVPIRLDGLDRRRVPYGLRRLTAIEAASGDVARMVDGLKRRLSAPPAAGDAPRPGQSSSVASDPAPDAIALRARLVVLFPERDDTAMVLQDAGFDTARFDLGGSPLNRWHKALGEVQKHTGGLDRLLAAVRRHGYTP